VMRVYETMNWGSLLLALGILALFGARPDDLPAQTPGRAAVEREFLDRHWTRPLGPQGPAPAGWSSLEVSQAPESCGTCHPAQFADWRSSLHARSMGPGVTGQLVEMKRTDPETARYCLTCHAPLFEQQESAGPAFDRRLRARGLACAACHVRRHERFGPPRRDGSPASGAPRPSPPHNGVTRTSAFLKSEFCSACHQLDADGLALNGQLLQNTFEEWKASPAAREGRQCQDCHMPDRRHLWRGIHDIDTVRRGVEIALTADRPRYRVGDVVDATLTIATPGVGHYFPTYVTPKVVVRTVLVHAGRELPSTAVEHVIGRQVPLDLSREIADTRIPPGGRVSFAYRRRLDRPGLTLRVVVTVFPDDFYARFFESLLASGAGAGTGEIRAARDAAHRSAYALFTRDLPLT